MATDAAELIAADLLGWMEEARRDLPWRRRRDPYAVWVSEIMLQQTQAGAVAPYFERWLDRFPDIASLAAAPLSDVLKAWEGLGYYARARHLHQAAQRVVSQYGGQLPAERKSLLDLPGIGRYTAGAILSLAFGRSEPVLDGNVRRALCRLYDVAEDPRSRTVEARLWSLAQALVDAAPSGEAGALNEALMELGALVCTPARPLCAACPLAARCLAHARGVEAQRPARAPRAPLPHYDAVAAVVRDGEGHCLVAQRPLDGLLGGLWEFPGERSGLPAGQPVEALAGALAAVMARKLDVQVSPGARFLQVRHAYTHFRITLHAFHCTLGSGQPRPAGYAAVRWVAPADLTGYPLPVTDQKILAALGNSAQDA